MTEKKYNAAIYCRLSRDDGKAESVSIQHQRDMLIDYANDKGYGIFDVYAEIITLSLIQCNDCKGDETLFLNADRGIVKKLNQRRTGI